MLVGSKSKALQPNTVSGQVINLNTDSTLADGLVTVNCDECALWTVNLTSAGEWAGNQRPVQLLLYYLSRQLHQLLHRTSCLDSQLTNTPFLLFSLMEVNPFYTELQSVLLTRLGPIWEWGRRLHQKSSEMRTQFFTSWTPAAGGEWGTVNYQTIIWS